MMKYLKKQIFIVSCIYLGQLLVGFGGGWSAPTIPILQDPELTPLPDAISDGEASLTGTLLYVGVIIGPYLGGYLSNVRGRKPCLFFSGMVTLLAFVLLALASTITMIFIGRILMGVGVGIMTVINMVYIGEIASTNIRGTLLTITGIFHTSGTLVVYSVTPYVPYAWTNWLGTALTILYLAGLCTIPESPVFHILVDKEMQAKETLLSLGRPEDVDKMLLSKQNFTESNSNWLQIFTVKTNRRTLFINQTLSILQQTSGVVAVMFFATSIFQFAGSSIEPNIATIIIGVAQIASSIITPFFVDRTGRRSLLLISTASCCLSLAMLGLYFQLDDMELPIVESIKWLPLVSLICFFFAYDLGFGIIPGTLMGEMFTSNVRSSGSVFVMTVAWSVGFGVSTAFGYLLPVLGGAIVFWVFSASCAIAFFFSLFFVPETKGKSLAEILEMLSK